MRSTFWRNRIFGRKIFKIVKLAWNSLQNRKTVRFRRKLYNTRFSGHAQHVLAKSDFLAPKFSKSWNWPQILFKSEKQCVFHENCPKRSFQVMRSTFRPNRIFERQSFQNSETGPKFFSKRKKSALFRSCAFLQNRKTVPIFERQSFQNRHAGLKFSPKRENSAPSMKIVQNAIFRSCAALFVQIAFLSVKVLKIVTLAWNSRQNGKTVHFPWKCYKTLLSGHAQHVLAKSHFGASKFSKSWNWPQILFKAEKQCAFHENCTKCSFQVMRSRLWPNRILERQSSENRHAGLKFSRKRENSAPSMKIVQDALFRSCAARFGEIAFLSGKVFKIVKLAWNSLQNRKTVRFRRKLYKTRFSGHAQHVLAKSDFWAPKFSKSWNWP